MQDEPTQAEAGEQETPAGVPVSGPVTGFVDTIHTPVREPVAEAGAQYLEDLEKGYIGERTDEAPDDSVYQAPTDGDQETPKTPSVAADNDTDYEAMTVEELSDELRDRNLPVSGVKAELIERLQNDDAGA